MLPIDIKISNFKSYHNEVSFEFPTDPGLYLLSGENRAGKSTLWDALSWALYGKTIRGLSGKSIKSWGISDSPKVEFSWIEKKENHKIIRTPDSIIYDDSEISQDALIQKLSCGYDLFLHTKIFGQTMPVFFDLTPENKLDILSNILDLSGWTMASENAKRKTDSLNDSIIRIEREIARNQGILDAKMEERCSIPEPSKLTGESHQKLVDDYESVKLEISVVNAKIQQTKERIDKVLATVSESDKELLVVFDDIQKHQRIKARLEGELSLSQQEYETKKREISSLKKSEVKRCPTCNQKMNQDTSQETLQRLRGLRDLSKGEIDNINESLRINNQKINELLERSEDLSRIRQNRFNKKKEREYELQKLNAELVKKSALQGKINGALCSMQATSMRQGRIEALEKEIASLTNTIKVQNNELVELKKSKELFFFWIRGFKEIRLRIVEGGVSELENLSNNILDSMGMQDWRVFVSAGKEQRDGTFSNRFSVSVQSPDCPESLTSWHSYSGGELQRIRIAGAMALASMTKSRLGIRRTFQVWDEPTTFLSESAIDNMLGFMQQKAIQEKSTLWIVDHRGLSSGDFSGRYKVLRSSDGTTKIVED